MDINLNYVDTLIYIRHNVKINLDLRYCPNLEYLIEN